MGNGVVPIRRECFLDRDSLGDVRNFEGVEFGEEPARERLRGGGSGGEAVEAEQGRLSREG